MDGWDSSYAEGENYEIVVRSGVALVLIWERPDLERAAISKLLREVLEHVSELAASDISGVVVDQTHASPLLGRDTREATSEIIAACAAHQKRAAFVVAPGVQYTMMIRLTDATFLDREEAKAWVASD
jgi:hypothetical protein